MISVKTSANAASLQVATTRKVLLGLIGYNAKTSDQFIQVFNSASTPADGAAPDFMLPVKASSGFTLDLGFHGIDCSAGIYICNSSTQQTKTIGSADCWFNAQIRDITSLDSL